MRPKAGTSPLDLARRLHKRSWAEKARIMNEEVAEEAEITAEWEGRSAIRTFWLAIADEALLRPEKEKCVTT